MAAVLERYIKEEPQKAVKIKKKMKRLKKKNLTSDILIFYCIPFYITNVCLISKIL